MAVNNNPFLDDEDEFYKKKRVSDNPFFDEDNDELELLRRKTEEYSNRGQEENSTKNPLPTFNEDPVDSESGNDNSKFFEEEDDNPVDDKTDSDDGFFDDEDDPFTEINDPNDIMSSSDSDFFGEEDDEVISSDSEFEEDDEDEIKVGQSIFNGFDINEVLAVAIDEGNVSDVTISAHMGVAFTVFDEIYKRPEFGYPDGRTMLLVQQYMVSNLLDQDFVREKDLDTSYVIKEGRHKGRRFRLNLIYSKDEVSMTFRTISDRIPALKDLDIDDVLVKWFNLKAGLILVNGPTGSGKALRLDTLLPTPDGVKTMRDIEVGDNVYDSSYHKCRVTGVSEINHYPELYKITLSDNQVIFADKFHQWLVKDNDLTIEEFESMKSKALKAALQLSNFSQDFSFFDDSVSFDVVMKTCNRLDGFNSFYPDISNVENDLLMMDVDVNHLNMRVVLSSLSCRLLEKFSDDEYMILNTLELFALDDYSMMSIPSVVFENEMIKDSVVFKTIEKVDSASDDYGPVKCISVDSIDKTYLCADNIVTHNSSTTASLLRDVQLKSHKKIVTAEKPIEFVYPNDGRGVVVQREVGQDTHSFAAALKSALRANPRIILIGEVRDQEEISELIDAAETGHLAISTMHTDTVATTINRIKSMFSGDDQVRVLLTLSETLKGIMNQTLVKTPDGSAVFAVREILSINHEVRALIANGDPQGVRAYQQRNKITMEHKLAEAAWEGRCTFEEAESQAVFPEEFVEYVNDLKEEKGPGNVIY